MTVLTVDSREDYVTKAKFKSMEQDYKDLTIEIKALKTFDYENEYMGIEFKNIDDFISSFTEVITRKDGTRYHRLESQVERMLSVDKPYKMLMIHGNISDIHSQIHPNSVLGMVSSIYAKGIDIIWVPKGVDYPQLIYRLHKKTMKYGNKTQDEVMV